MPNTNERAALVPVRGRARWLRTSGALASVARDGEADARHAAQRSFLKAGPRWLLALGCSGSRGGSARGRRARHAPCRLAVITDGGGGTARAGSRDFSLRSPERGRLAPPDNGAPLSEVARFGPRARARTGGAPAGPAGARLFLEARALDIRSYVPPPREPRPVAPGSAAAPHGSAAPALGRARAPQGSASWWRRSCPPSTLRPVGRPGHRRAGTARAGWSRRRARAVGAGRVGG